jgi:hypothetical protein
VFTQQFGKWAVGIMAHRLRGAGAAGIARDSSATFQQGAEAVRWHAASERASDVHGAAFPTGVLLSDTKRVALEKLAAFRPKIG